MKLLQMSLSDKISEKLAAMNRVGGDEIEERSDRSPSSSSTVSSSGEVEGAYTLYTDDEGSESNDDGEDGVNSHVIKWSFDSHVIVM